MNRKKIFFVHTGLATFVESDIQILSENYLVYPFQYNLRNNFFGKLWSVLSLFFVSLYRTIACDVVYVWFGGKHGFFPILFAKLLGKKSIVIVGGYDASYVPSIQYGVFYHGGFQLWVTKKVYQWVTYICPVDESLVCSTNYYADPSGQGFKTGILNFMDLPMEKFKVIPTGYDILHSNSNENHYSSGVITCAYVTNDQTWKAKGLDIFCEVARRLPNEKFTIIGLSEPYYKNIGFQIPENISVITFGILDFKQIFFEFRKYKVFLLPSLTEGKSSVLCEAMLCGCIPVVSDVGGMRNSVGDTGYVIERKDSDLFQSAVQLALKSTTLESEKVRSRAVSLFSLSTRKQLLSDILSH